MDRLILKENRKDIRIRIWTPSDQIVCLLAYDKNTISNFSILSWGPVINRNLEYISQHHKPTT
jgi:hypothetical protein